MLIVHHLNNSRSQRILWMLEELGADYEIKRYARNKRTMRAPDSLKEVHPLGKSPVVSDGEEVLAETGHIIETVVERHGAAELGFAAGTPEAAQMRYWLHFAEGSAMTPLMMKFIVDRIETLKLPFFFTPLKKGIGKAIRAGFVQGEIEKHLRYMEQQLGDNEYFVGGKLSGADIALGFPLEVAAMNGGLPASKYPGLSNYLDRIQARPAYQTALKKAGDYDIVETN